MLVNGSKVCHNIAQLKFIRGAGFSIFDLLMSDNALSDLACTDNETGQPTVVCHEVCVRS